MPFNFTLRIHKPLSQTSLAYFRTLVISGITILSKQSKFDDVRRYNSRLFDLTIKGTFNKISGSNSYPTITFKEDYIDLEFKGFPRYPCPGLNITNNPKSYKHLLDPDYYYSGLWYKSIQEYWPMYRLVEIINIVVNK